MLFRRFVAVALVAIPLGSIISTIHVSEVADVLLMLERPDFIKASVAEYSELDSLTLAKALVYSHQLHQRTDEVWTIIQDQYESLIFVLLALLTVLAIALSVILWIKPSKV